MALKNCSVAEAKFLRAWAYYKLVSMWGAVPFYTKLVASATDFQPRTAVDQVYNQIIGMI